MLAAMSRIPLPEAILKNRVLAISRGLPTETVVEVAEALAAGGIQVLEVTLDSPGALDSIAAVAATTGGMTVGAGTVRSVAGAADAVAAGAEFLISPHVDPEIIRWAVDHEVPSVPGAFTATEILTGWDAGASAVKVFPAFVGGPLVIATLLGPLADVPLMPSGGVTIETARDYLDAGAISVGFTAWLTAAGDLGLITERARQAVAACAP
jgi:2-dehydro-3-deoxyphosphogluconate aldolase/(4S)-4-hydroxy-2-oxoglutarate aldolase